MLLKISAALGVLILLFLAYVSTREGKFRYERSGLIAATPEDIYPYISNLKMGGGGGTDTHGVHLADQFPVIRHKGDVVLLSHSLAAFPGLIAYSY